jgi:hypothetical protein
MSISMASVATREVLNSHAIEERLDSPYFQAQNQLITVENNSVILDNLTDEDDLILEPAE